MQGRGAMTILRVMLVAFFLAILFSLWLVEKGLAFVHRRPTVMTEGALGANALMLWWTGLWLRLIGRAKLHLGRGIQRRSQRVYRLTRRLIIPQVR